MDFDACARETPLVAADLAAMLPPGSRVHGALWPDSACPPACELLRMIELDLRGLAWGMADKDRRGPEPSLLTVADMRGAAVPTEGDMEAVARALGILTDEGVTEDG